MELTLEHLAVLGVIASVIVGGLRLLADRYDFTLSREVITAVLFVVSVALSSVWFGLPVLSGGGDPMQFAGELVGAATAVFGGAAIIYNVLLNRVLRKP